MRVRREASGAGKLSPPLSARELTSDVWVDDGAERDFGIACSAVLKRASRAGDSRYQRWGALDATRNLTLERHLGWTSYFRMPAGIAAPLFHAQRLFHQVALGLLFTVKGAKRVAMSESRDYT